MFAALRPKHQRLNSQMSAVNSSVRFPVLLRHVRTPEIRRSVLHHSVGRNPTVGFHTSSRARSLETSPLVHPSEPSGAVLHPTLKPPPLNVVAARGTTVTFSNGKTIEDTSCGAAVACIGYGNERVKAAMMKQIDEFAYSNSMFYGHPIGEELAAELIRGTNGEMAKVYLMCSGMLPPL